MKRLIILTILLILSKICFTQHIYNESKIANKTKAIVKKIAKYNQITSSHIYYEGRPSEQWANFQELKKKASTEELIELTNYSNVAVKGYAFLALIDRKEVDLFPIIHQHLKDTEIVEMQSGCLGYTEKIGDYFIENAVQSKRITKKQKKELEDILLNDAEIKLSSKNELLQEIEPKQENYLRIREIAIKEKNPIAIFALSKYRKQEDKELIKNLILDKDNRYYGLRCVINFPDEDFFPLLQEYTNQEIKKPTGYNYSAYRVLYKAVVQYKNQASIELLEKTLKDSHPNALKYHKKYIWMAITKFPDTQYSSIKKRIEKEVKESSLFDMELSEIEID